SPDTELFAVLELLSAEGVAQLPVLESGEFLGMISRENVLAFVKVRGELGI
ncbi:MAG: CBS domain-containing protein, partial [Anaerolineae bacterium]|nr:CBS domain-containing protein [Anaerolineae bacterium]